MSASPKPEPGTAVQTQRTQQRDKVAVFRERLSKFEPQMSKVLPSIITPERMTTLALTAATKTPALLDCTPESIVLAMMQVAQWGLELGRTAHLVPFGKTCTAIADWKGLVQLILASGHVRDVKALPVYSNERFRVEEGLNPVLEHERVWAEANRGSLMAFYAVAYLRRGGGTFEVMTKEEVERIRQGAASRNSDAWKNHFVEMGKKTVIRRLAKRLPQSQQMQDAIAAEDRFADLARSFGIDPMTVTDGAAVNALQSATHPQRQRQLPPRVSPDDPYVADVSHEVQPQEAVRIEPGPRTDAQRAALVHAAAHGKDPFEDSISNVEDGIGTGPGTQVDEDSRIAVGLPSAPASDRSSSAALSGPHLAKLPFNIGLAKVGTELRSIATEDLNRALTFARDVGKYSELVENIALVLDDRRFGDAAEPTA